MGNAEAFSVRLYRLLVVSLLVEIVSFGLERIRVPQALLQSVSTRLITSRRTNYATYLSLFD